MGVSGPSLLIEVVYRLYDLGGHNYKPSLFQFPISVDKYSTSHTHTHTHTTVDLQCGVFCAVCSPGGLCIQDVANVRGGKEGIPTHHYLLMTSQSTVINILL